MHAAICRSIFAVPVILGVLGGVGLRAEPVPVELRQAGEGWRLFRGGEPFFVNGAGGGEDLAQLAEAGGNATRTWGVGDDTMAYLDEAHRHGIAVVVGIWLQHARYDHFDYDNPRHRAEQLEKVREAVLKYKDHPAVLAWSLGNEIETHGHDDNQVMWENVNDAALIVKELDPHHPTMTVTAELGSNKIRNVHRWCPDIDIIGINSYAGAPSVPQRYRQQGGTKPYMIMEFGPFGQWEAPKTAWGDPIEESSTAKGARYRATWEQAVKAEFGKLSLGGFAFLWGEKQEETATWFGMFLSTGHRLEAVDVMTQQWTGRPPENRSPQIGGVQLSGGDTLAPGAVFEAQLKIVDPERDELRITWHLRTQTTERGVAGEEEKEQAEFAEAIVKADGPRVRVRVPDQPGAYRLFAYAYDDANMNAAVVNVPLLVDAKAAAAAAAQEEATAEASAALQEVQPAALPLTIYGDGIGVPPYAPTGWMGEMDAIKMDEASEDEPHAGATCLKAQYTRGDGWGGVVWQHPFEDWGDRPGGHDLTGATKLSFWARGSAGGEVVKFGFGLLGADKKFRDSSGGENEFTLTDQWKRYEIDAAGRDLSTIKTGFMWVVAGQGRPVTFYLDDIAFE